MKNAVLTLGAIARLTSLIEHAEKAAREAAAERRFSVVQVWLDVASQVRRDRAELTGSL